MSEFLEKMKSKIMFVPGLNENQYRFEFQRQNVILIFLLRATDEENIFEKTKYFIQGSKRYLGLSPAMPISIFCCVNSTPKR